MKPPPSVLNSQVTATVESLGGLGDGIAKLNGKPLFVPKSCPGDVVKVRVVHENRDGYQGIITKIITPSTMRVAAPCKHFDDCGGCTLQQLSGNDYRSFKAHMYRSAISYAGYESAYDDMIFCQPQSRRRIEFRLSPMGLSLLSLRSVEPVPISVCEILEPTLQALLKPLDDIFIRMPLPVKGVSLTLADSGIDMLLTLRTPDFEALDKLIDVIKFLPIARISAQHEETLKLVHEFSPVTMRLGNYDVPFPADAFLQATKLGQEMLTGLALYACEGQKTVDLFCGIGTYSFPLSSKTDVHAVESDTRMIWAITDVLKHNTIESLTVEKRDLFKMPLEPKELERFGAAIINPPRAGAKEQTEALAASNVKTVVMISCNPATFSRDAKILKNAGFRLERAVGIDQFVWSPHLEIVGIFRR